MGEGLNNQGGEVKTPTSLCPHDMPQQSMGSEDFMPVKTLTTPAQSDSSCMLSSAVYAARASLIEETEENKMKDRRKDEEVEGKKQSFPMKQILLMEMSWYTSPEEGAGESSSCASDVYRLGVLLFEVRNRNCSILKFLYFNRVLGILYLIFFVTKEVRYSVGRPYLHFDVL